MRDATIARGWLIEHASSRHRAELERSAQLDARIVAAIARAAERWPTADDEAFAAWLAGRLSTDLDVVAAIEAAHVEDLALAHACCRGDSSAIAEFERTFAAEIHSAAAEATPSGRREFEQHLRALLFVPGSPKLAEYGGRGTLRSWVRITARRAFLNHARGISRRREVSTDDDRMMNEAPASDPELQYLKEHYRSAFAEAFASAMRELSTRDRNLLRQHLVHDLNIDEIGALYGVHRSTAARWIARAREAVLDGTRAQLTAALRVDVDELGSIMRLIASRLDVTVSRHLRTESDDSREI